MLEETSVALRRTNTVIKDDTKNAKKEDNKGAKTDAASFDGRPAAADGAANTAQEAKRDHEMEQVCRNLTANSEVRHPSVTEDGQRVEEFNYRSALFTLADALLPSR